MKSKYLILGKSGSGKTTIINEFCKRYNYKVINSYTTREPRYDDEKGHIFINNNDYIFTRNKNNNTIKEIYKMIKDKNNKNKFYTEKINHIAVTNFNKNIYWATKEQLEKNDFYIIDWDGIKSLSNKLYKEFNIKIIYINIPLYKRIYRLIRRDGLRKAMQRLWTDFHKFKNLSYDYEIYNYDLNQSIEELRDITKFNKRKELFQCK